MRTYQRKPRLSKGGASFFATLPFASHIVNQGGIAMNHEINIINKKGITVSAVSSIDAFDENCIFVNLQEDGLMIYGKGLHIEGLDLEEGVLTAAGQIDSIAYAKKREKKSLRERFRR